MAVREQDVQAEFDVHDHCGDRKGETEEQGVRQELDSTPKANPMNRGILQSQEPHSFMCGVPKASMA